MAEQSTDRRKNEFQQTFAVLWSVFTMLYVSCITFIPLQDTGKSFANTMLGFLIGTAVGSFISFFFGSSKSSQTKDSTIASLTATPAPPDNTSGLLQQTGETK